MPRQDTVDFLTAFAVGTVLGIGATLLLQPTQRTTSERIAKQLKPYRKKLRRSYRNLSRGVRQGSAASSDLTSDVIGAGRELLGEFRNEVADILDQARSELRDAVQDQVKDFTRSVKKTRRRVGV
jgi:gas vesicle protein